MPNSRVALLAIKPEFAHSILEGIKLYEFRKVKMKEEIKGFLLYASSPIKALVGYAEVENVIEGSPQSLWRRTREYGGISYRRYMDYFAENETAFAFKINKVHAFSTAIDPKGFWPHFKAPQSFMYVDEDLITGLLNESYKQKDHLHRWHTRCG